MSVDGVPLLRSVRLELSRVDDPSAFPFTLPAVGALERGLDLSAPVTMLVGENGSGKSTIVEALADKLDLDAEGGDTDLTFVAQRADSPLAGALALSRGPRRPSMRYFLRAESFFNVAREIDRSDPAAGRLAAYGGRALHGMSHGESFLTLAAERFLPDGLFLLDEPEAALSPQGCMSFLRRMHELVLDGAQFVVATHSPFLLLYPGATVYALGDDGVERVDGADTDHVRLTRLFLDAPDRFLRELFS